MRRDLCRLIVVASGFAAAAALSGAAGAAEEPARLLFGKIAAPAALEARAVGFYSRGCLAGGVQLPVDGPAWQAMRLSRNRNWGHPRLVALVERLARESKEIDGWPGLLVGDLAQPRGGPMLTGHRSHQVGLDADIWLMPMPENRLSRKERETVSAVSMIKGPTSINPAVWKPGHVKLLKRAASYREVERVFVHPAIKKALCDAAGKDAAWLHKVRPYWGHHYHFHVRIKCPPGSDNCRDQKPPGNDPGCGKELDDWLKLLSRPTRPVKPGVKPKKRREIMMSQLPAECRAVLEAEDATPSAVPAAAPARMPAPKPRTQAPAQTLPAAAPAGPAAAPPPERKPGAARPALARKARNGPGLPWLQGIATPSPPPLPARKPQ